MYRGLVKVEEVFYLTVITFHASLLIGVFAYASKILTTASFFWAAPSAALLPGAADGCCLADIALTHLVR